MFDKHTVSPAPYGYFSLTGYRWIVFTDERGSYYFDRPAGVYVSADGSRATVRGARRTHRFVTESILGATGVTKSGKTRSLYR